MQEPVVRRTNLEIGLVSSAAGRRVAVVFEVHLVAVVLPLGARLQLDGPELREVPLALRVEADEAGAVRLRVEQGEEDRPLEPCCFLRDRGSSCHTTGSGVVYNCLPSI